MTPKFRMDHHASGPWLTSPSRRALVRQIAAGATVAALGAAACAGPVPAVNRARVKAIAFDGLAVFDVRPIAALAETLFPGKGAELSKTWRARQFEYTWLRTIARNYVDFWQVTEESLVFAARLLKLELSREARERLMHGYLEIEAWPDVAPALRTLQAKGVSLTLLSNFTVPMLAAGVTNSGLEGAFASYLSTDRVRAYKPDPRSYQMAQDELSLGCDEILFVPFAGWDVAGAKTFGYPTFWMNRLQAPAEELGAAADGIGTSFNDLLAFMV